MIKAIIFDFDGVIIESADIKTEAFKELFFEYPERIKDIVDYHLINGGISRFVKFRYIYETIIGRRLSKEKEIELGERFSEIVLEKVLKVPFVRGVKEFLDKSKNRYQFFIASGTPDEELKIIIRFRELEGYFREIFGSPMDKADIINRIIAKYNFYREEVVYVGDAQSDKFAAKEAEINFIERTKDTDTELKAEFWIKDFIDLKRVLEKIEKPTFNKEND